jgi:serine/threonine protein kinase
MGSFVLDYSGGTSNNSRRDSYVAAVDGLPKGAVYKAIGELLAGVAFMHRCGVAHRDIKPDNLLVDGSGAVRISDFGCAEYFGIAAGAGMISHTAGTIPYWAPEMLSANDVVRAPEGAGKDSTDELEILDLDSSAVFLQQSQVKASVDATPLFSAFAQDMWAVGIVLHCLLFNQAPYSMCNSSACVSDGSPRPSVRDPLEVIDDIRACSYFPAAVEDHEGLQGHSEWARELIQGLLCKRGEDRLTAEAARAVWDKLVVLPSDVR